MQIGRWGIWTLKELHSIIHQCNCNKSNWGQWRPAWSIPPVDMRNYFLASWMPKLQWRWLGHRGMCHSCGAKQQWKLGFLSMPWGDSGKATFPWAAACCCQQAEVAYRIGSIWVVLPALPHWKASKSGEQSHESSARKGPWTLRNPIDTKMLREVKQWPLSLQQCPLHATSCA